MRSPVVLVGVGVLALGCGSDLTSGTPGPVISHDVSITARLGGHSATGDSVTIHIANSGTATAYLPRCGTQPLLLTQQFANGVWTGGVQNFLCIASEAGPVTIPAGSAVDVIRILQQGRYRMMVGVASKSDLSDRETARSEAFDTP